MGVFTIGKVLVDSLFKKTACRMYPVVPREWEERTRGAVGIDIDGCVLCGMCQRACPTNAITVDRKAATWSIERMNCIQCRGCVDSCPPKCLIMEQKYTEPNVEKVIDTFDIPQKKKAPKKDAEGKAPAADAAGGDGPLTCDEETCVYCGLCAKACPADALEVTRKPEKVWKVDEEACVKCGVCIDKCPKDSLSFGGAAAPAEKAEKAPAEEAKEEAPAEKAEAAAAPAAEAGLACAVDDCVFCGACAEACPVDAIKVEDGSWEVDKDTCIECSACVDQCPANCLTMNVGGEGAAPAEEAPAEEAKDEAPAEDKKEAPAEAMMEKAPRVHRFAEMDTELTERIDGFLGEVKENLVKDHGMSEEEASKRVEAALVASRVKRFPYLMGRGAKSMADEIKD